MPYLPSSAKLPPPCPEMFLITQHCFHSKPTSSEILFSRGITCGRKHQRVVSIDLSSSNLQGSLSPAIGNLSFLRELILYNNTLAGRLPISISNATRLWYFDVTHNGFIGGVPSFGGLKRVKYLSLDDNPLGNGKSTDLDFISSLLNSTATLLTLYLGKIPEFIGKLQYLKRLNLSFNNLEGEIPTEGIFKNKTEVEVVGNNLCGEYGMGSDLSTFGDMYSYGILLLEIFTNKSPTSDIFNNGLTLHNYVRMSMPEQVIEIVDPKLFNEEANATPRSLVLQNQLIECLVSIFKIGIACSMELPRDRMSIGNAVKELHSIKDTLAELGDIRTIPR
nr:probable LRR receptor-like serine/threonine-protein kinase At3g47570 [Ipomoea batatas]